MCFKLRLKQQAVGDTEDFWFVEVKPKKVVKNFLAASLLNFSPKDSLVQTSHKKLINPLVPVFNVKDR